ncbi:MAG: HAMP domain-containing sensor histidine kinase [Bacteroidetes bacterium]|jgi:two-component system phosphate regulon sensor histidine kinase PhoR|nr:HAMP domain-containing sensor histidine kinase [Bacteroidota bacterium]
MKPKLFTLIIIVAFISLLGVVIMQVYWVQNAISLKEEQYNNSVRIAMKSVLNRLLEIHTDSTLRQIRDNVPCYIEKTEVRDIIREDILDSLIKAEMSCMEVGKNYEYMIYSRRNQRIAMGNHEKYKAELFVSEHQQSIAALYKPGNYYFSIYFPGQTTLIYKQLAGWMILSAALLLVVILSFWYTVYTIIRQKKISEIRTDFINNMTHEFKTPIATISLASEMLLKPEVIARQDKAAKYAKVIIHENARLQNQVEQILQIAILDKGETRLDFQLCNVHELLKELIQGFQLLVDENNGKLTYRLNADKVYVNGDPMHLSHMISNVLDNAIKYSAEAAEITIETTNKSNTLIISISDNGIGIAPENHDLIFKNLYRVHTGNVHNVKGFGIGLYYVKRIVQLHGGNIKVISDINKGSTFVINLPIDTEKPN